MNDILKSIRAYIELERASGITEVFMKEPLCGRKAGDKKAGLSDLKKTVLGCVSCNLHKTRKNVVFGAGNELARLMFVGEAPGRDEDEQGLPFVGRAGQLLTKIIEAMGLKREDVYIANILKCRPPDNRPPMPEEVAACQSNVRDQIKAIKPKVIVTLGKFASQTLLETETPISILRGKFHEYEGVKVMPTFHPAYLLRNPDDKKLVWADMKKVMSQL